MATRYLLSEKHVKDALLYVVEHDCLIFIYKSIIIWIELCTFAIDLIQESVMELSETTTLNCKIKDGVSITFSFDGEPSNNEYCRFCDKIKSDYSLNGLCEDDKLKLFLLSNLMAPSILENFVKDNPEVVLPNESGILTLRASEGNDCISNSEMGIESWKIDDGCDFRCSQYALNLELSPDIRFNKDFICHFLMNFGGAMKWTQSPKVAEIISSCVSDVTKIVRKDKYLNRANVRYAGHIDWQRLKDEIKNKFGATIKIRRSEKSDIWNVYVSILEQIFKYDVQSIVRSHQPIKKGIWIDEAVQSLIGDIRHKYNVEIKDWQIKGMLKKTLSNQNVSEILIDIVRSKLEIYPFLVD